MSGCEAQPAECSSQVSQIAEMRHDAVRRARAAHGAFVLVTPVLSAMQAAPASLGTTEPVLIEREGTVVTDDLAGHLVSLGYERADVVEHRGEFAVRGGIVAGFPGTARRPARVEPYGDDIASIRACS